MYLYRSFSVMEAKMTYSISRRLSQKELKAETSALARFPRKMSPDELTQEAPDLIYAGRPASFERRQRARSWRTRAAKRAKFSKEAREERAFLFVLTYPAASAQALFRLKCARDNAALPVPRCSRSSKSGDTPRRSRRVYRQPCRSRVADP